MGKRVQIGILMIIAASILLVVFSGYSQETMTTVNDSAFSKKMRPPVPFVHDEHNEKADIGECSVCHHVYKDGKRVEDESSEGSECSECHGSDAKRYPMDLVKAFHTRCKGCHLERKAGPILCAECHSKG